MKIEEAIKKAIEGGYRPADCNLSHSVYSCRHRQKVLFLDPTFWQCLGKAMGWNEEHHCPLACCGGLCPINIPMWQSKMHQFIDNLVEGKTATDYFNNLDK